LQPASIHLRHSIQTNGMLLTPEWCDFLKRWDVGLGVSIDGPQRLHDSYRVTRSGRGTFRRTLDGIRLLRSTGVPFHVITVLTRESLDAADELLNFYLEEGIEDICFNVEESEGDHVSGLFAAPNLHDQFRSFLDRFWQNARRHPEIRFIREIHGMLPRIFRPEGEAMRNVQVEPFGMLNVDCHGNVSSFSPELLGLKNAAYNDFVIGNILVSSLETMQRSTAMAAMARDIAAGVEACRARCGYFSICGGGAPVNKLTENGSFCSERTSFCALTQMIPTDLILNAIDRLSNTAIVGAATAFSGECRS
jgi:uncharacterized protein